MKSESARLQWQDPEFRARQIESARSRMIIRWQDPEFRATMRLVRDSTENKERWKLVLSANRERYRATMSEAMKISPKYKAAFYGRRVTTSGTDIESLIEMFLQEEQIDYKAQAIFWPYRPDFYLPKYHLVIECDGLFWHDAKRDARRDAVLTERYGLRILRLPGDKINLKNLDWCIDQIATAIAETPSALTEAA